jgi:hypothetical protein
MPDGYVGLRGCGKPLALVEHKGCLRRRLALLWFRNRGDELGAATRVDNLLCGLSGLVESPMLPWACVGGVYNGMVEKWIAHRHAPETTKTDAPCLGDV